MKIPLALTTALASVALIPALLANQTVNLGYLQNGNISIATESTYDGYIRIVDTDTNAVVADANCLYNGGSSYQFYGYSPLSGVSATQTGGQNLDITGLPAGNYQLESIAEWGTNSSNTSTQSNPLYIIDWAPSYWDGYYQVSYFISAD